MIDLMWTSQTALAGFFDVPEAIELAIQYVNGRYKGTPVYITENGELHTAFGRLCHRTTDLSIGVSWSTVPESRIYTCSETRIRCLISGYSQWSDASREELIDDVRRKNYLQGYVTYLSKAVR